MKIGVLASGNLGLKTLIQCASFLKPLFIATDSQSHGIIEYARNNDLPLFLGNPRKGKLAEFLRSYPTEVVFSINYLFLIEEDVLEQIPIPINFHGSLLPKYRGRTPHVWSIINNETEAGVTAHRILVECDAGPVILQRRVPITPKDTGATVLAKYEVLYPELIGEIFKQLKDGSLREVEQDHSKATFFGKRTPEDGRINWDWQRERIYNWVRAQASPYPGAFTFSGGVKYTIDELEHCDHGFSSMDPNGLILDVSRGIVVKTPNGAVRLTSIRENIYGLKKGNILE